MITNVSLLFFGLSGISAVFPVIRVFPVNLGTATMMKKAPNESKLIYAINFFYCNFPVSDDFLLQSFKHTDKLKCHFFSDVNVASMRIVIKNH